MIVLEEIYFNVDSGNFNNLPEYTYEDYLRVLKDVFMYAIKHYSPSSLGFIIRHELITKELQDFFISEGFRTPLQLRQWQEHPITRKNKFNNQLFILQN